MAPKSPKIVDVKHPGKTAPTTSSRPIVVTNRPILTSDPMMVAGQGSARVSVSDKPAELINRTAKAVEPIAATRRVPAEEVPGPVSEAAPGPNTELPANPGSEPEVSPSASLDSNPGPAVQNIAPEVSQDEPKRDSEAEATANETAILEAQEARQQELESLVASGKYNVPINAVQRKRSRARTIALCLLALVLALVLLDVVFDMGTVKPPVNLPHTHFFSTTHTAD